MLSIGQIMNSKVEPVFANQTIGEIAPILRESGLPGLPVVDKNRKLLGVIFMYNRVLDMSPDTPLVK